MGAPFGSSRARTVLIASAVLLLARQPADGGDALKAPPFPHQDPERWVGRPVRLEELRGRVVLLDVWTFG